MTNYSDLLKDPRWQKKRLEIFKRDGWSCRLCGNKDITLVTHHKVYLPSKKPWEYPNDLLITLCEDCHSTEPEQVAWAEECIIKSLRELFISPELFIIADGFDKLSKLNSDRLTARVYEHALSETDIQNHLVQIYRKYIKDCGLDDATEF